MGNAHASAIIDPLGREPPEETRSKTSATSATSQKQDEFALQGFCGNRIFTECMERPTKTGDKYRLHKFSRRAIVLHSGEGPHTLAGGHHQLVHYGNMETSAQASGPRRAGETRAHGFKPHWLQASDTSVSQTPTQTRAELIPGVPRDELDIAPLFRLARDSPQAKLSGTSGARVELEIPRMEDQGLPVQLVNDAVTSTTPSPMPVNSLDMTPSPMPWNSLYASSKAIEHSLCPRAHLSPSHTHEQIYGSPRKRDFPAHLGAGRDSLPVSPFRSPMPLNDSPPPSPMPLNVGG